MTSWRRFRSASPNASASVSSTIAWSFTASPSTAIAKPSRLLTGLRLTAVVGLFLVLAPLHIASAKLLRRSFWPPRFLGAVAWLLGTRIRREGADVRPHTLLVANHTSWLDILVLAG